MMCNDDSNTNPHLLKPPSNGEHYAHVKFDSHWYVQAIARYDGRVSRNALTIRMKHGIIEKLKIVENVKSGNPYSILRGVITTAIKTKNCLGPNVNVVIVKISFVSLSLQ